MLNMFFAVPCEPYAIDPIAAEALDLLFILHADHEQNASTSTVRLAGSTGANPYAAISAGVSALWGTAHGGANEAVLDMLDGIGSVANIDKFLARVKDKSDSVRLMGFGHRVYKNFDPRAKIIRGMCYKVLERLGRTDHPLFDLALKLEEIALKDDYFVSRRLYPNVDFYSGIIYSALVRANCTPGPRNEITRQSKSADACEGAAESPEWRRCCSPVPRWPARQPPRRKTIPAPNRPRRCQWGRRSGMAGDATSRTRAISPSRPCAPPTCPNSP
jgi:hypothetical protein